MKNEAENIEPQQGNGVLPCVSVSFDPLIQNLKSYKPWIKRNDKEVI